MSANSLDLRPVSALCVSGRSIYKHLPGVTAYDKRRGAAAFDANTPAVAHPPCRLWSKFLSHQAKSPDVEAEKELGRWCVRTVMKCGGVVEQPAHSRLWDDMKLPMPMRSPQGGVFTIYVEQGWFGYATRKPTWLLVCGVPFDQMPEIPFRLERAKSSALSAFGRSRTVNAFAEWLVSIARRANQPGRACQSAWAPCGVPISLGGRANPPDLFPV